MVGGGVPREIPTPKVNIQQFDLVTRSCVLNPFLLREIADFCELQPDQSRVAFNFLQSFEKYIVSIHLFEYSKIEDKLVGCKALLRVWDTILRKFSYTGTPSPECLAVQRKGFDFIIALANRIDLDIDPVWYRWCKKKKRSRLVREFKAFHQQYMQLLTHSTRLALTKLPMLEAPGGMDVVTKRFVFRMLSISILRLPVIRLQLLDAFTDSFEPLRLRKLQQHLERAQTSKHTFNQFQDIVKAARKTEKSSASNSNSTNTSSNSEKKSSSPTSSTDLLKLGEIALNEVKETNTTTGNNISASGSSSSSSSSSSNSNKSQTGRCSRYAEFGWITDMVSRMENDKFNSVRTRLVADSKDNKTPQSSRDYKKGRRMVRGRSRSSVQLPTLFSGKGPTFQPLPEGKQLGASEGSPAAPTATTTAQIKEQDRKAKEDAATDYRIVMEHPELFGWDMFQDVIAKHADDPYLDCVVLEDAKSFRILKRALGKATNNASFYEFYATYLYHIARRCYQEIWERVPAFLDLTHSFLTRFLDHRIDITLRGSPTAITQIVNVTAPQRGGLNWAQAALMLNPDPDGWFHNWLCTLTLKTTKGNDRLAVVRCWDSLNEWTSTYITAMRRMNRRPLLSAAFCGGALTEAVRVTSGNSHFNVLFSVLSFIYNHWYNIPDVQLITIIQILTSPERLHGLFFHWCFAVRRLYHHFLVYIVGALQNAVDTLTNQAQKIASEAAEAEAMLDSDITTEDPEPPRGGLSKFFACFSKCYGGDNDDAAHGQRGHRRGLSRDRSSRTEISLCRVTTPLYSNILDNGLTKVGPLATLVVFVDEEMNEPRSDDALLDFYQTDVSKLVVDVEERVKVLVAAPVPVPTVVVAEAKSDEKEVTEHQNSIQPEQEEGDVRSAVRIQALESYALILESRRRFQQDNKSVIRTGQFVYPTIVDITPRSTVESTMTRKNKQREDERRKSFQLILQQEALGGDAHDARNSEISAALFRLERSPDAIAHARRHRERMRVRSGGGSLSSPSSHHGSLSKGDVKVDGDEAPLQSTNNSAGSNSGGEEDHKPIDQVSPALIASAQRHDNKQQQQQQELKVGTPAPHVGRFLAANDVEQDAFSGANLTFETEETPKGERPPGQDLNTSSEALALTEADLESEDFRLRSDEEEDTLGELDDAAFFDDSLLGERTRSSSQAQ